MEAKKKLSAETLTGAPGPAATPTGNRTLSRDLRSRNGPRGSYLDRAYDVCFVRKPLVIHHR